MTGHVRESLSDWLDEQLAGNRRTEVQAHLDACESCRGELARLREVSARVRALPLRPLPPGFMQRLARRRAGEPTSARRSYSFMPAPLRLAAFAASSVIVSLLVYDRARLASPIMGGTPSFSVAKKEARLPSTALSAADIDAARAASKRPASQSRGEPLIGFQSALSVGPAATASGGLTNEQLQEGLERQKSKMGIRSILPKSPSSERAVEERLDAAPQPLALSGASTPALLAQGQTAAAAEGLVLKSDEERAKAWKEHGMRAAPPKVNYKANMVALVVAPDLSTAVEVIGVQTSADGVAVRYRLFQRLAEVASVSREGANLVKAYQFRVIPRTDKQVSFERVD